MLLTENATNTIAINTVIVLHIFINLLLGILLEYPLYRPTDKEIIKDINKAMLYSFRANIPINKNTKALTDATTNEYCSYKKRGFLMSNNTSRMTPHIPWIVHPNIDIILLGS